jgi:hypothetical protein
VNEQKSTILHGSVKPFRIAALKIFIGCKLAAVSWRALSSLAVCLRTCYGYAATVKIA